MIQISGHWVNPEHVSTITVIGRQGFRQRNWDRWLVEVQLVSGYSFFVWEKGSDNLSEAEENRDRLAARVNSEREKIR